jgi:hypothetical protein
MIATVRAILAARMATWTTTPICWPNTPPLSTLNAPWVRFSVIPSGRTWPMTGTKRILEGEIVVQVFAPSGSGDGTVATLADSIGTLFSKYGASGVQCDEPNAPSVIGDMDGWYQINAVIPWRAEL